MSGVIRQFNNVFMKFIGRFIGFRSGNFELSRGVHRFLVEVDMDIEKVWINTDEVIADGCGTIPVNKVGCTAIPGVIIFDAIIETDRCLIQWFATC